MTTNSKTYSRLLIVAALAMVLNDPSSAAAPPTQQAMSDVVINGNDGTRFAGTLYKPAHVQKPPVLVFVHGSERLARQQEFENIGARHLIDAGYAVLIVDKRGVGETAGTYEESADINQMAADALAQVEYLKGRPDVDGRRIGLFGVSRGGWAAPLAASQSSDVSFVVIVSGPGVSPNASNIYARGRELLASGVSAADVERISEYRLISWNYYGGIASYASAKAAYNRVKQRVVGAANKEIGGEPYPPTALSDPAFQFFRRGTYEPKSVLAHLKIPLLAFYGSKDQLIPARQSFEIVRKAVSHNPASSVVMIDGAGHGMRVQEGQGIHGTNGSGVPRFAPRYWPTLISWLNRRVAH